MADLNRRMAGVALATDPGVSSVAITGTAQTLNPSGRAVLVSTAGTITGKLIEDTADADYILPVGLHALAFKSITSVASLVGRIIR